MIPAKTERDKWRSDCKEGMVSALWEYCPEEFTTLLDAVDELEQEVERLKAESAGYKKRADEFSMSFSEAVIAVFSGVGACSPARYAELVRRASDLCGIAIDDKFKQELLEVLKTLPCPMD